MKETRLFYAPEMEGANIELPADEAAHALRVLRMKEGDALTLCDGRGTFAEGHIALASTKHCLVAVDRRWDDHRLWRGAIHLAVAPTKNMDRMEWLTEKATEIGLDALTLLDCRNSERRTVKTERLEKICVSAMKQSHKAFKPYITPMTPFAQFVTAERPGQKFIAHCYSPEELTAAPDAPALQHLSGRDFLLDRLEPEGEATVLIGPEGDFSLDEVRLALEHGYRPISLGESRLRTETAALVAVHLMYLAKRRG